MRNLITITLIFTLLSQPVQATCSADSGAQSQHLLELYTSEGCSSCPPADRFLSGLKNEKELVPLAFHVDYWDRLGWSDRFAKAEFSRRQQLISEHNDGSFSYTPQLILDGRDWRENGVSASWRKKRVQSAGRLNLQVNRQGTHRLAVEGSWSGGSGQIYVALYENNLESNVVVGENAGRRLHHDFVVRELLGPLAVADGNFRHTFDLHPRWKLADIGIAAFVTAPGQTTILQAVHLPLCAL